MQVACIVAYPQYKITQKRLRNFIQELKDQNVEIHEFDLDKLSPDTCNDLIRKLDRQKRHILIHMSAQLVLGDDNPKLRQIYNEMVSRVPSLVTELYDDLETVEKFTSRTKIAELLVQDDVLSRFKLGTQRKSLILKILDGLLSIFGTQKVFVCKPETACVVAGAHDILFLRCAPVVVAALQSKNYVVEPFINSEFIYKVYCFRGETLLINKVKNNFYGQESNFKRVTKRILRQETILVSELQYKPIQDQQKGENKTDYVTKAEEAQIKIVTAGVHRVFGAKFFGYDLCYDAAVGRFVIIDVNYNPMPKDGDGLADAIVEYLKSYT